MKKLGIENPRIGFAGLNPHAGESGLFGKEEIEPAIRAATKDGLTIKGPIPPGTVFSKLQGGQYDLVVVMYHDQGHIPGTAFGKAGEGRANPESMLQAIRIAAQLAASHSRSEALGA